MMLKDQVFPVFLGFLVLQTCIVSGTKKSSSLEGVDATGGSLGLDAVHGLTDTNAVDGLSNEALQTKQKVPVRSERSPSVLYHLLSRHRRWDFTNGCHCHGYHVECMSDDFCSHKYHSDQWSCHKTCCGFACKHEDDLDGIDTKSHGLFDRRRRPARREH